MAGTIPDAKIEEVRAAAEIVSVVQEYVPLKRKGRGYWANCPFHKEKTPSFHVNSEKQLYKCFGCGEGGDVFSFIQKYESVGFLEAVRILARRVGVQLPETEEPEQAREVRSPLYDANAWAAGLFHKWLTASAAGRPALKYLRGRNISDETISRFQLGYAPDGWDNLLKEARRAKLADSVLIAAGLAVARDEGGCYDRFRNRIMFPILDPQGRVVGFGGRVLGNEEPKYLNTSETALYQKGRLLYLAERAKLAMRESRNAIVVEGYMDAIVAHENDFTNTVAVLGTALTPEHVRYLKRFADEVFVVFDGDSAGVASANRSLEALTEGEMDSRVVVLPDGLDPCDFLQQRGRAAFLQAMAQALDGLTFRVRTATAAGGSSGALAQARAVDDVLELIARMPNPVSRSYAVERAADLLRTPPGALRERLQRAVSRARQPGRAAPQAPPLPRRDAEVELLQVLLNHPETVAAARSELDLALLRNDVVRQVAQSVFDIQDENHEITAGAVLARTRDEAARDLVGRIIETPFDKVDPTAWCRELLGQIRRQHLLREAVHIRERFLHETPEGGDDELLRLYLERKRLTHETPQADEPPEQAPEAPPEAARPGRRPPRGGEHDVEF